MANIILKTYTDMTENVGLIRLTPEAETIVRKLKSRTGLPFRRIVSEIIIQAEPDIIIKTEPDEDEA